MNTPDPTLRILSVDIGGTGLKAALLDLDGNLLGDEVRVPTPHPCEPADLVSAIVGLAEQVGREKFQVISLGFPGILRDGEILAAPTLDTKDLVGFNLVAALSRQLGCPVRALNDASMQGFGSIEGRGLEMIVTLGTGMGSAIFRDGALAIQLELSTHPAHKDKTYNEYIGAKAFKHAGKKKWNKRVEHVIAALRSLTRFDRLYLGGGNSARIEFKLPPDVKLVPNVNGLRGGAHLWRTEPLPAGVDLPAPPAARGSRSSKPKASPKSPARRRRR